MRILDLDAVPTDAISARMRARLTESIAPRKRRHRRAVIAGATAFALIFGGGAMATAEATRSSKAEEAALAAAGVDTIAELGEVGLTVTGWPEYPVGLSPAEEEAFGEKGLKQLARAQILDPTQMQLEEFEGFEGGQFLDDDSLVWVISWHGKVPDRAREYLDEARARGLETRILTATYSSHQIDRMVEKLARGANRIHVAAVSLYAMEGNAGVVVTGPKFDSSETRSAFRKMAHKVIGDVPIRLKVEQLGTMINGSVTISCPAEGCPP